MSEHETQTEPRGISDYRLAMWMIFYVAMGCLLVILVGNQGAQEGAEGALLADGIVTFLMLLGRMP